MMSCLVVFIVLNWKLEFHVHTNVSNFALEIMLGRNPDNNNNKQIYYAN